MQRSFDDLGTPLAEVTFCVVDLETTGASVDQCTITEIGAVKMRGGTCLGTFQTLVNPGAAIPPEITVLTGITQAMVQRAPRVEAVLPAFVEFAAGCVLVGHNVRFDVGFLNAALQRDAWPRLAHPVVDTAALARRLIRDEVPNCRLGTLASRLRLDHRPCHRALDDALATADLLHLLLERAAGFGVLGLDDLLALPRLGGHPQVRKLRLTTALPRSPGVYLFIGDRGEVLYVGKATNLRQRVRSYFSGDDRRSVGPLLREMQAIRHQSCATTLEAAVNEVRLIHQHQPRYNRVGTRWKSAAYVALTCDEAFPRLTIVRAPPAASRPCLGPMPPAAAGLVVEAIHTAVPIRRCSIRLPRGAAPVRDGPCTPAQLGVALCPCAGGVAEVTYRRITDTVVGALAADATLLLQPLRDRMHTLAGRGRYEEAAAVRDRAAALAGALRRQRRVDALRRAGRLELALPGGAGAEVDRGVLVRTWTAERAPQLLTTGPDPPPDTGPLPRHLADEVTCVAGWLDAEAHRVRIHHCDGGFALPIARLPTFTPSRGLAGGAHW